VQERKKAEQNRDLLASIVESSDDAIIGTAPDGTILTWNCGASRIFKYDAEQIESKSLADLFAPESLDRLQSALETVDRNESVERYEGRGRTSEGRVIDVQVTLSPIRNHAGASAIIRDTTEQKRFQREFFVAQKMEAIGRLAGGIAHDFNNLLTAIIGYSQMSLARLHSQDPMRKDIEEVESAGQRAAALTGQLLAFSRKQVVQPQVLALNTVVTGLTKMLQRLIGEDIELETSLDPDAWHVKADRGQIEQIIMNLAVNSRDAMPEGGNLTIETSNVKLDEDYASGHIDASPGPYVMLAITDSGSGMDKETESRIFEPFFTTKEQGRGTGLGLSTVYGIVKQSGGSIGVYSEPGRGTTFKVYLPRVEESVDTKAGKLQDDCARGTETVLIIEDSDTVRKLARKLLQEDGYTVLEASSGDDGWQISEQHNGPIDLLLTDVVMPGTSGRDIAQRLTARRPRMRVLYMSGYTDDAIVRHRVLDSTAPFIQKPFTRDALIRRVREVLDAPETQATEAGS